jgi:hypothetical protein
MAWTKLTKADHHRFFYLLFNRILGTPCGSHQADSIPADFLYVNQRRFPWWNGIL